MLPFKAVLFDLDGTLLDTLEDLADSMNSVLASLSLPQHPVEAYKLFVGDGVENLATRVAPKGADASLILEIILGMRSEYSKRWASKTRPYPGIGELLDALIAQQVKIAVFSNKPHEFTELCVTNLLGKWRFDAVRGLSSITPRKPDPSAALAIAQELGVDPSAFVYLGDTNTDMLTATRAGMFAVGVLWGFRGANELLSSGARALLHYPLELLSLSLVPSTVFERR